jgi:phosphoribosylanthranilate isomerase
VNSLFRRSPGAAPLIKICGLQSPDDVEAAIDLGADLIGIVFAESPRKISVETARTLVDAAQARAPVVGVFVDASPEHVRRVARETRIDLVQLSGSEEPDAWSAVGLPLIKVIHSGRDGEEELRDRARAWLGRAQALIVDSWSLQGGGSGHTADWSIARSLAEGSFCPVLLAGGLTAANVAQAIARTRPSGVDVSSGVERDGRKDRRLIQEFIQAVRATATIAACEDSNAS